MLSDNFDKKVKEAAENHHPAYDEKAWTGMEKLLNKHLPQGEKERRRFIFFLLFFLLLGGGAWLIFSRPGKHKPINNNTVSKVDRNVTSQRGNDKIPIETEKPVETKEITNNATPKDIITNVPLKIAGRKFTANRNISKIIPGQKIAGALNMTEENKAPLAENKALLTENKSLISDNISVKTEENKTVNEDAIDKNEKIKDKTATEEKKTDPAAEKNKKEAKNKKQNSKRKSSFFFTVSGGPDLSTTGFAGQGKVKLFGGGGLGYSFRDKLSIRAGFYTGRKIYTAKPEDYHAPATFYSYYPNLQYIEANCKVYEIPVSVSYHFGKNQKQNWFASAGVSSYLLKNETYDYFYKYTSSSPTISRVWTVKDKNNHYFSVLTFSGGYQRKIGKIFSISAEPYIKFPMKGVGFGKVKLNSTGILFSVGVKPFK